MLKWKWHFILVCILFFWMKRTFCFEYYSIISCGLTDLNTWTLDSLKTFCGPLRFVFEYPWKMLCIYICMCVSVYMYLHICAGCMMYVYVHVFSTYVHMHVFIYNMWFMKCAYSISNCISLEGRVQRYIGWGMEVNWWSINECWRRSRIK